MQVGLIGYGKIGRALEEEVLAAGGEIAFILDPALSELPGKPLVSSLAEAPLTSCDLVCECATRDALASAFDEVIAAADLLCFSLTAFSDEAFQAHARAAAAAASHTIFIPHGAILGLDGIFDGRTIINEASIVTTKSPASLGLDAAKVGERQVMFEGTTREACSVFPRNVNVHAAIALAGIGFDRTHSTIVADPAATTNTHQIHIAGEGINFTIEVSSFTTGGITGVYTPLSAVGSLRRATGHTEPLTFV